MSVATPKPIDSCAATGRRAFARAFAKRASLSAAWRVVAGTLLAVTSGAVYGVTCTAVAGTNNWGSAATWTGCSGGIPQNVDSVVIPSGATVVLNVDTNRVKDLNIAAGGVLRGDNTGKQLFIGNASGNDITNAGIIDFGQGNLATVVAAQNTQWTGGGTWNLSAIDVNNKTLTFSGAVTLNMSGAAQPIIVPGTVTSLATTTWNFTGTVAQTLPNSATVSYGVLNVSNTTGVTLGQAMTSTQLLGDVAVNANGVLNNGGFSVALANNAGFSVGAGARFNLTGTSTMVAVSGTGTKTFNATSTVNYGGSAQTVTAETYGNLSLSGSGTKTMPGAAFTVVGNFTTSGTASATAAQAITVDGDVTLGGGTTFNAASFTHNFKGDFTNNGATFTASTSTINLNGTAAQAIGGTTGSTFRNLTVANAAGVTLNSVNATVSNLLTLSSGAVTTGANTLITTANCNAPSISRTGGHVAGFLRLHIPTGSFSCTFHVGDSATYRPINVAFTTVGTAGDLTGSVTQGAGDHPDTTGGTSGIDATDSVNRYWTLANAGVAFGGGGSYQATLNYVSGDLDSTTNVAIFVLAKGDACSGAVGSGGRTCTGWTLPTLTAPGPSTTQITATGMTTFSDFAAGKRRNALNNFLITIPVSPVDSCTAQNISITARNSSNVTITNYTGTISLGTSSGHGDWSNGTGLGTFTAGGADLGAATYAFVAADNGVVTLRLTDTHADTLTITVSDAAAGVSNTSASLTFSGNAFVITNDAVQVAGRDQSMSVKLIVGASCGTTNGNYGGSRNLKAWLTRDASDPGGAAPAIGALSLPSAQPGANNLTLVFTAGVASFSLATADVGKYVLNLRDDNRNFATGADLTGTSATITTRPFALVVSGIRQGATDNPGGTATTGSKFIAADDSFQASVGAYLWNSAADSNVAGGDGIPDASATLAQITAAGAAPSYRWPTTLSAGGPISPGTGSLGAFGNGVQSGACPAGSPNCFAGGVSTPTNLKYSETGSFTLSVSASNFLNSGVNLTAANGNALVFDNSGTPLRNGVVGRFYPDHFMLLAGSVLTPACGTFSYMDQALAQLKFSIEARNKSDNATGNYSAGTVTAAAENNNSGTDLSTRLLAIPASSWLSGRYDVDTNAAKFARLVSPDGPYDSLMIGVTATDPDGAVLAARDMDPATSSACTPATCTAQSIAAVTKFRFGRVNIPNIYGTEKLDLKVPVEMQYWSGTFWQRNTLDSCSSLAPANVALGNYTGALAPANLGISHISISGTSSGLATITITKPSPTATGSVELAADLGATATASICPAWAATATSGANRAHLRGNWCGGSYDKDPVARLTFGIQQNRFIFNRENY